MNETPTTNGAATPTRPIAAPAVRAHLSALELRLSHELQHLATSKSETQRALRRVWITQIEKEIAAERAFLGIAEITEPEMSDSELLAALNA